jgi:dihydrofolate reductase/dihydrofolate reductase (trimethoprim resistance protein)
MPPAVVKTAQQDIMKTIIISTTENITYDNCITVSSLHAAFDLIKDNEEAFVAGGGQVYKDAMPYADKIYITVIDKIIDGNIYFPELNKNDFEKTYEEKVDGEIPYTYYTYERVKKLKKRL